MVIGIAVAAVAYTYLFGRDGIDTSLLTSEKQGEEASLIGEDLIGLLNTLKSITLDDSFFQDPAFRSLEDFSQELAPEPVGRSNPFAPIGRDSGSAGVKTGGL